MRVHAVLPIIAGLVLLSIPAALQAEHRTIARVERALASGDFDLDADIGQLLTGLENADSVDEKREFVSAIADIGGTDSQSPNAVKAYLLEKAPPLLLDVVRNGNDPFLQGDAMAALRDLGASRAILEQAAAIAEKDPDSFVQSRGEIMRNYVKGMPVEDAASARGIPDAEHAQDAIGYLDERGIAVSTQSLRDAAGRADVDTVRALIDAGIAPDAGATTMDDTPLAKALSQGCIGQGQETDWLVETVRVLVISGADLKRRDDNQNSSLIHAAHWCGPRIVRLLADAGGDVDHRNGSGTSALTLAIYSGKVEVAEALVKKGACLNASDREAIKSFTGDARMKAVAAQAKACKR